MPVFSIKLICRAEPAELRNVREYTIFPPLFYHFSTRPTKLVGTEFQTNSSLNRRIFTSGKGGWVRLNYLVKPLNCINIISMAPNNNYSSTSIRDSLALSRTIMANERTLLAYIRTGMTFIIAGAGIIRFIQDGMYILIFGCALIVAGFCFLYLGFLRYRRYKRSLETPLPK